MVCASIYFLKNVFTLYVLQVKQVKKKKPARSKILVLHCFIDVKKLKNNHVVENSFIFYTVKRISYLQWTCSLCYIKCPISENKIAALFLKRQNQKHTQKIPETNKNHEYFFTQNGSVIWVSGCETSLKTKNAVLQMIQINRGT